MKKLILSCTFLVSLTGEPGTVLFCSFLTELFWYILFIYLKFFFLIFILFCQACTLNHYGPQCSEICKCGNGAQCNPRNGQCTCLNGWIGPNCLEGIFILFSFAIIPIKVTTNRLFLLHRKHLYFQSSALQREEEG